MFNILQRFATPRIRATVQLAQAVTYCNNVPRAIIKRKPKAKDVFAAPFVDLVNIKVIGGKGGNGSVAFSKKPRSKALLDPNGGDGGNGGHVVFEASRTVNDLVNMQPTVRAASGENGKSKERHGEDAEHSVLKVPVGTIIRNENGKIVGDLKQEGSFYIAARGGAGGRGNPAFKSDIEEVPKVCEYGAKGETKSYTIELKSMAHLGFIGLPNAGKSTLLQAITRSRTKVAAYAFTTLHPHLGVVTYEDFAQVTIADLPGLVAGSHQNKGLGIQFLKHAERCSVLLFVIDLSCEEPWKHYETLCYEIGMFSQELLQRPQVIIGNKIDIPEANINLESMKKLYPHHQIIPISAKMGTNLENLLKNIRILYDKYNRDDEEED